MFLPDIRKDGLPRRLQGVPLADIRQRRDGDGFTAIKAAPAGRLARLDRMRAPRQSLRRLRPRPLPQPPQGRAARRSAAILIGSEKIGRIYIPTPDRLNEEHWLVQLVGADAARAIAIGVGHGSIDIPPAVSYRSRRRRQWEMMARMTAEGASLTQIARALGIDRSTARRARKRPAPPPLPLFDR